MSPSCLIDFFFFNFLHNISMYEKWKEENVETQRKMKSKVIKHKRKSNCHAYSFGDLKFISLNNELERFSFFLPLT